MQVKLTSYGQTDDLEVRSKINKFRLHVNFKDFLYQTLRVLSKIKDRKHFEQNFYSVAGIMRQGRDLGGLVKKLKRRDLRWRPIDCEF